MEVRSRCIDLQDMIKYVTEKKGETFKDELWEAEVAQKNREWFAAKKNPNSRIILPAQDLEYRTINETMWMWYQLKLIRKAWKEDKIRDVNKLPWFKKDWNWTPGIPANQFHAWLDQLHPTITPASSSSDSSEDSNFDSSDSEKNEKGSE